jgi:hypothetical protein
MSFLRHKEIYQSDDKLTGAPLTDAPSLIVLMSFRLAIPQRVALQHCPPPLHQPRKCLTPLSNSMQASKEVLVSSTFLREATNALSGTFLYEATRRKEIFAGRFR